MTARKNSPRTDGRRGGRSLCLLLAALVVAGCSTARGRHDGVAATARTGSRLQGSGWSVEGFEDGQVACLSLWRRAVVELSSGVPLPAQTVCLPTPVEAPAVLSAEVVPGSRRAIVTLGWVPAETKQLLARNGARPAPLPQLLRPLEAAEGHFFAFITDGPPLSVLARRRGSPDVDVLAHHVHRCPGADPLVVTNVADCQSR